LRKFESIFFKSRIKQGCSLLSLLCHIIMEVLAKTFRKHK
jgi:hypothetical protein